MTRDDERAALLREWQSMAVTLNREWRGLVVWSAAVVEPSAPGDLHDARLEGVIEYHSSFTPTKPLDADVVHSYSTGMYRAATTALARLGARLVSRAWAMERTDTPRGLYYRRACEAADEYERNAALIRKGN